MSNLTFEQLLKAHPPEPLEGHAVVVFERVGEAGELFHSTLFPGAAPIKKGMWLPFRKRAEYFAYSVGTSPERHLDFSECMRPADHVSEFRVVFNLMYGVVDARVLVQMRMADPLRQVRDRVRVTIKREVEQLPWQAVREAFPQHASEVVDDCMDELRAFAGSYGLAIHALWLTVRLPETMDPSLPTLRHTLMDRRVRPVEGRIEAALQASLVDALRKGDLRSAKELLSVIPELGTGKTPLDPAWAGSGALALPEATRGGELYGVLGQLLAATGAVHMRAQRQALRSALLHLAAELLVDDTGDGAATLHYAERVRAAIALVTPPPAGPELDAMMALADPQFACQLMEGENALACRAETNPDRRVMLSGSGPMQAQPDDLILVQFAAYIAGFETHARQALMASAAPEDRITENVQTDCQWAIGAQVSVCCQADGLVVRTPVQEFAWDGKYRVVQFDVKVPVDAHPRKTVIVIEAYVHERADSPDAVQVARLQMPLQIAVGTPAATAPPQMVAVPAPRTAFASYAAEDRIDVLERVSSISQSAGLKVFMDVVDLRVGEHWNPELSRQILASDRFLLFWSEKSANSKWVRWEWQQAIAAKGDDVLELHLLRYTPIELVPEELRKFNFGDVYIRLRDAELYRREQAAKAAAARPADV